MVTGGIVRSVPLKSTHSLYPLVVVGVWQESAVEGLFKVIVC